MNSTKVQLGQTKIPSLGQSKYWSFGSRLWSVAPYTPATLGRTKQPRCVSTLSVFFTGMFANFTHARTPQKSNPLSFKDTELFWLNLPYWSNFTRHSTTKE